MWITVTRPCAQQSTCDACRV